MYVGVVRTDIEMERLDEAIAGIANVKERLTGMPGFVRAAWLRPVDGGGLMISVWADESAARDAAPPVGFSPAPGVTVAEVDIREVIDTA